MARIRTIKPTAFSSESLSAVSVEARWTFAGIWTYVDDEGRGKADPRLIKAHVWPLDDHIEAADVDRHIDELEAQGMVQRYAVAGRSYLMVTNFGEHQRINRPTASSLPPPSARDESLTAPTPLREPSPLEGKGREGNSSSPAKAGGLTPKQILDAFDEFWAVYPRKVAKEAARAKFATIVKRGVDPAAVIAGAKRYAVVRRGEDPQFTKQPDGWLNAGRWQDDVTPAPLRATGSSSEFTGGINSWTPPDE